MILGLTALGEGRMPTRTRIAASLAHLAGGALGGAGIGVVLWIAATPFRTLFPMVLVAAMVVAVALGSAAIDMGWWKRPARGRQVPPGWLAQYGPVRSYFRYGVMFGLGFATVRTYATGYACLAAMAVLAPLEVATLGGLLYGAARTGVIGPASNRATFASLLLYRSRTLMRGWRFYSGALAAAVAGISLQTIVGG